MSIVITLNNHVVLHLRNEAYHSLHEYLQNALKKEGEFQSMNKFLEATDQDNYGFGAVNSELADFFIEEDFVRFAKIIKIIINQWKADNPSLSSYTLESLERFHQKLLLAADELSH